MLFEVAGLPLGIGLFMLSWWTITQHGRGRLLVAAAACALVAAVGSAFATLIELPSFDGVHAWKHFDVLETLTAMTGGLGPVAAGLLIGLRLRALDGQTGQIGRRALLVALTFFPLMIVGGIAADVAGERFLEVGLLVFAGLWLSLTRTMQIVVANREDEDLSSD